VGVKLRLERPGQFLVLDVVRLRGTARQIEQAVLNATRLDGASVHIGLPEDPGQAGKSEISHYVGLLSGYHVVASRESGSKVIRAQPLSAQMEYANLSIV
jgi:phage terminase large subunit-like protein